MHRTNDLANKLFTVTITVKVTTKAKKKKLVTKKKKEQYIWLYKKQTKFLKVASLIKKKDPDKVLT